MSDLASFDVCITLKAPFLFEGLEDSAFGVDVSAMRDHRGQPIIPRAHIKGHLVEALRRLATHNALDATTLAWLVGDESRAGSNEPNRGHLVAEDFVLTDPRAPAPVSPTTRVQIDPQTGGAAEGALVVAEAVVAPGTPAKFTGRVHLMGEAPPGAASAIPRAFTLITAMGAQKSVGFGRVDAVSVKGLEQSSQRTAPLDPGRVKPVSDHLDRLAFTYRVRFNQPLVVDIIQVADNAVTSATEISGATIKGALAARLEASGVADWSDALSRMTFWPAKPATPPAIQLRTRTAIDSVAYSAVDGKLFSQIECANSDEDGKQLFWHGVVTWPSSLGDTANKILRVMASGLYPVGQTKAIGTVEPTTDSKALDAAVTAIGTVRPAAGKAITLTLSTDANLLADQRNDQSFNGADQLRAYFQTAFGAETKLSAIRISKKTRVHGGYRAHRFRLHEDAIFAPFLVFEPEASFTLEAVDLDALALAVIDGLPNGTIDGAAVTWRQSPFVRENGFGRFTVTVTDKDTNTDTDIDTRSKK